MMKEFLLDEVVRDKKAYQFLADELRADRDIALASIQAHGTTIAFAPL